VTSGLRRDADEICPLLGYYAASSGNLLLSFGNNVSVQSSRVQDAPEEHRSHDTVIRVINAFRVFMEAECSAQPSHE
jgi:hypothetical protein